MKCGISSALLDQLKADAEAAGPAEICGLLVGEAGLVTAAVPLRNAHPQPDRAFALDLPQHLRAARAAREAGKTVLGHYHSHPSGNAAPSASDAVQAREEGIYWLILAAGEARLWMSCRGGSMLGSFEPVELVLS
jgi:proteasome lid subunit RPN8/RPN11